MGKPHFEKITSFFSFVSIPTPNVTTRCVCRPSTRMQTLLPNSVPARHSTQSPDFQQTAGIRRFASIHLTNLPVKNYHVLQRKCVWSHHLRTYVPCKYAFSTTVVSSCSSTTRNNLLSATVSHASHFIALFELR